MSAQRRRVSLMSPVVDRISNLPNHVIEIILMRLPLRDAVRTSILSRNWRYEWNTLPQLLFDENCVPYPEGRKHTNYDEKLVDIVNHVLFFHCGPIRKFKLAINLVRLKRFTDVDRWLIFLSRNGIKELSLNTWDFNTLEDDFYKVPSCLYLCKELTCLWLSGCIIALPASFKGFSSLTTLDLHSVNILNNELDLLISLCPLLTKLVLENIDCGDHLNVCASKLVHLGIDADFIDLCFENTPLLAILSLALWINFEDQDVKYGTVGKLAEVFCNLPKIERLELSGETCLIFTRGKVPVKFSTACHLKYLSITINFGDKHQMLLANCIFRSSPMLQELCIEAFFKEIIKHDMDLEDLWEAPPVFTQLRTVEVTNFMGTTFELELVESLLANAPVLEKVQIEVCTEAADMLATLEMMNFRRASSKVNFFFFSG